MGTRKPDIATSIARAAYPKHIILEEHDGIFWLRGESLTKARAILGLKSSASGVGFDSDTLSAYVSHLAKTGIKVGLLRGGTVRMIEFRKPTKPGQVPSTIINLAPELLVGHKELERLLHYLTLRRSASFKDLVARVRETVVSFHKTVSTEYGALYVYEVAPDMYEVDEELTTIPKEIVDAILVTTHQSGRLLSCRLVLPKSRRGKNWRATPKPLLVLSEPVTYGQLRFNL